jgi:hypothetical protein
MCRSILTPVKASLAWNWTIFLISHTHTSQLGALAQSAARARRRIRSFMSEVGVDDIKTELPA